MPHMSWYRLAGEGADIVMADATKLGLFIWGVGKETLNLNLISFEKDMLDRACPPQEWLEEIMKDIFFTGGTSTIERYL